jgi:hypothetical protein
LTFCHAQHLTLHSLRPNNTYPHTKYTIPLHPGHFIRQYDHTTTTTNRLRARPRNPLPTSSRFIHHIVSSTPILTTTSTTLHSPITSMECHV